MDLEHCTELRTDKKEEHSVFRLSRIFVHTRRICTGVYFSRANVLLIAQIDQHSEDPSISSSSPISAGTQKVCPLGGKVSKGSRLKRLQSSKFLRQNPTSIQEGPYNRAGLGANGDEPATSRVLRRRPAP